MKILIAPNTFKGSLTAFQVADIIGNGLDANNFSVQSYPIADGGDETLPVFLNAFGGKEQKANVMDPLGRAITAKWGLINSNSAIVELAEASGIRLLKENELNPLKTSSYGTGQLLDLIINNGIKKIYLGIGGSATVDGGAGLLRALGAKFYQKNGEELTQGNLTVGLHNVDFKPCINKLEDIEFTILFDVDNPLLGQNGAARIFGPQKGASNDMVHKLEESLDNFSKLIIDYTGRDFTNSEGSGAAGGIGYSLRSLVNADMVNAMDYLITYSDLMDRIKDCDIVITGEGKIDSQSLMGKGPVKIAKIAREKNKPCIAVCGKYEPHKELENIFDKVYSIMDYEPDSQKAIRDAYQLLNKVSIDLNQYLSANPFLRDHTKTS